MIAELHCHSTCIKLPYFPLFYDAVQTVEEILEQCRIKNIEILAITEHDSLNGYRIAKKIIEKNKLPIILVPGCEISSSGGHILAYGIFEEIPKGLSPEETVKRIHDQGGLAVAAHPFIWFYALKNKVFGLDLDAMETGCAAATVGTNKQAEMAAKKMGIPGTSSSDAHSAHGMGKGRTIFTGKIRKWEDVVVAIKKGEFRTETQYQSWARVAWDNISTNIKILIFG
jgi:predicted metal-dependent phosphoesterase TrpH